MKKKIGISIASIAVFIILVIVGIVVYQKASRSYKIEEITEFKYYTIMKEGKAGVIDVKGNTIIEPTFDAIKIPNPSKDVFICLYDYNLETLEYKTKILNANQEEILTQYQDVAAIQIQEIVSVVPYEKSVLKFKENGKYGLIDFKGKVIVKPVYDEIENVSYKEGELLVKKDDKYGVINIKGTKIVDIAYDTIASDNYYSENQEYRTGGYIVGKRTDEGYRYGYMNCDGKMLLKVEYNKLLRITEIQDDKNSYLIAEKNGKAGFVKNNKVILDYNYDDIQYDELNKLFLVKKDSKYGIIDFEGKTILNVEYDEISIEGIYIYANKENRNLVYDLYGNQTETPKYRNVMSTSNEKYNVTIDEDGKYGVEEVSGQVIIPNKYYYAEYLFKDYFVVVGEGGKSGILNTKDETILEVKYDVVQKIEDSNLIQTLVSDTGVLEIYGEDLQKIVSMPQGKLLIEKDYIKLYSKTDTKYFGKDGKEKASIEIYQKNQLFAKKEGDKWGFVDKDGNVKVNYQYDKVTEFNSYGFAAVHQDNKWGAIAEDGSIVLEPTYQFNENAREPEFIGKYYKVISGYGEVYYTDQT